MAHDRKIEFDFLNDCQLVQRSQIFLALIFGASMVNPIFRKVISERPEKIKNTDFNIINYEFGSLMVAI